LQKLLARSDVEMPLTHLTQTFRMIGARLLTDTAGQALKRGPSVVE